ncbi:MAG: hypothetical protein K2W99_06820 [Chthoniobacterales bacterium]|nr:hypothetical protein [Chthoniobacterales bacterium]
MKKIFKKFLFLLLIYCSFWTSFSFADLSLQTPSCADNIVKDESALALKGDDQIEEDADFSHYLRVDQRVALEKTKSENIIIVPQGQPIEIDLGKNLVEFSYDSLQEDYLYHNPWTFQQEGESLKLLPGLWEGGASFTLWPEWSHKNYQKIGISYEFRAYSLNLTTLTFTRNNPLYKNPKQLTFKFKVVKASLQTPLEIYQ